MFQSRVLAVQGGEVRKEAVRGMRRQKDGVLPDNDSSCHPGLGLYRETQLHAVLKGHDSMLMGGRPEARHSHQEDTLAWQVPRAPARGR